MTTADCTFCKISRGEMPSEMMYDDGLTFAIRDIVPSAPVHLLVIPFVHLEPLAGLTPLGKTALAHCWEVVPEIATQAGLESYRLVVNQGADAGQEVPHYHIHLLGGGRLGKMA